MPRLTVPSHASPGSIRFLAGESGGSDAAAVFLGQVCSPSRIPARPRHVAVAPPLVLQPGCAAEARPHGHAFPSALSQSALLISLNDGRKCATERQCKSFYLSNHGPDGIAARRGTPWMRTFHADRRAHDGPVRELRHARRHPRRPRCGSAGRQRSRASCANCARRRGSWRGRRGHRWPNCLDMRSRTAQLPAWSGPGAAERAGGTCWSGSGDQQWTLPCTSMHGHRWARRPAVCGRWPPMHTFRP